MDFRSVGYSKASTFPGYCKKHDSELFHEIEEGFSGFNERVYCLITLRALAREYFTKLAQIRLTVEDTVKASYLQKLGKDWYDTYLLGCKLAQKELEGLKVQIEKMLVNGDYSSLITRAYFFEKSLPISFSGSFSPEHTLSGNYILPEFQDEWGVIFVFCGKIGNRELFLLSAIKGQAEDQIVSFFESFDKADFDARSLALNIGLEYIENIFFRPSWIDSLTYLQKKQMSLKFQSGMPGARKHRVDCYNEINLDL